VLVLGSGRDVWKVGHNVAVDSTLDAGTPAGGTGALLVVLAGRPGTGKTTIGRVLAGRLQAAYLRTDVIAGPILVAGLTQEPAVAGRVAYDVAREVASENLLAGMPVLVDGVQATHERRALWRGVAVATGARLVQIEMTLSDLDEHRRRVEARQAQGCHGPTWDEVMHIDYDDWSNTVDGIRLVVDTADADQALARCLDHVRSPRGVPPEVPTD
jgi:predicted kinase